MSKLSRESARRRPIAALAGLTAVALAASSAAAEDPIVRRGFSFDPMEVVHVATVNYADLDLSTAQGSRKLLDRIERAAQAVCGEAPDADRARRAAREECRERAVAGSVRRVRSPLLAAEASGRATTARLAKDR